MIRLEHLSVVYESNGERVSAVDDVDLVIGASERVIFTGRSGAGKSSLLAALAGLLVPERGLIAVDGIGDIALMSADDRAQYRRRMVAMVLQGYDLLDGLSVRENLDLVSALVGTRSEPEWTGHCVRRLGLDELLDRSGHELSGGQRQRAAMCRCFAMRAPIVLVDEPTSALDDENSGIVADLLDGLEDTTIVAVTHDPAFALTNARRLELRDGSVR